MPEALVRAAAALLDGGLVAVPTDTVYGLVGLATARGVGARLAAAKGRDAEIAVQVLVADVAQADELAGPDGLGVTARQLAEQLWPGGLTVVTERRVGVHLDLGGADDSVGLRCPDHSLVRALCREVGPLAATSANRHGMPPLPSATAVAAAFGAVLAYVVDGGPGGAAASTVVDVRGGGLRLLREGTVPWADVVAAATA